MILMQCFKQHMNFYHPFISNMNLKKIYIFFSYVLLIKENNGNITFNVHHKKTHAIITPQNLSSHPFFLNIQNVMSTAFM